MKLENLKAKTDENVVNLNDEIVAKNVFGMRSCEFSITLRANLLVDLRNYKIFLIQNY